MKVINLYKWGWAILALVLFAGCSSSDGDDPTPEPPPPEPGVTMDPGEPYSVSADDRLVTTSLSPAKIKVVLELDENSGDTQAQVTLLEGEADLFQ